MLLRLWERLHVSYWFVPIVMVVGSILLAAFTLRLDASNGDLYRHLPYAFAGSADGARQLLSTLAGAMITVAGVAFSIMIVVLSLASQQFGPRLIRNFMVDVGSQAVLGIYIATFILNLIVLSEVQTIDGIDYVPRISITISLLLAMFSFVVLIYFIHHMARSVQVETVIHRVTDDLEDEIHRLYPEKMGQESPHLQADRQVLPDSFDSQACPLPSRSYGYVETVDSDTVMKLATKHDLVLKLCRRPGDHVIQGEPLALVSPPGRLEGNLKDELSRAFSLSNARTPTQDIQFSVLQMVEVAVRSLSPSINDPFTAMTCVDRLGAILVSLLKRRFPSPNRVDEQGRLRVVARVQSFEGIFDAALNQIRQAAASNVAVSMRLLETLGRLADKTCRPEDSGPIARHAAMVYRSIVTRTSEQEDIREIETRYKQVLEALEKAPHS